VNCRRLSSDSIPSFFTSGSTQPEWEEEGQPRAAPFCTFAEADQLGILERGRELLTEGGSRNEGGGKLPLLECKLILYFFFRAYRY
jgi:hypothetical protein